MAILADTARKYLIPEISWRRPWDRAAADFARHCRELRAFRNSCTEAPHMLIAARPATWIRSMHCAWAAIRARRQAPRRARARRPIGAGAAPAGRLDPGSPCGACPAQSACRGPLGRLLAAAGIAFPGGAGRKGGRRGLEAGDRTVARIGDDRRIAPRRATGWSVRAYQRLVGPAADFDWQQRFIQPNHLIELRPDGFTILQVLPSGPGRSLLRRHDYTLARRTGRGAPLQYLASRLNPSARPTAIAVAESTQNGIVTFGHEAAQGSQAAPAAAAFRRQLTALVPMLASARPPNDLEDSLG